MSTPPRAPIAVTSMVAVRAGLGQRELFVMNQLHRLSLEFFAVLSLPLFRNRFRFAFRHLAASESESYTLR